MLEKCNKVVVTGKSEYYYINRQDSIVNNVTESTITDYIELIMQRYDYMLRCFDKGNELFEDGVAND